MKKNEEQKWVMAHANKAAAILFSLILAGGAASENWRRYHQTLNPEYIGAISRGHHRITVHYP